MLQVLNFSGARQINGKASFFRYESCSAGGADESIRVRADGNDLGTFLPGDYVKLPIEAERWEVTPATPTAIGAVRLGLGEVGSARLTGVVSVVDGEKQKVMAGQCFRGSQAKTGATSGPLIQVWNPPGSGKNLLVQAIRIGCSAADAYGITSATSALPSAMPGITNMRRGGMASVAGIYSDNTGAAVTGALQVAGGYVQANSDVFIQFPRQLLIAPGEGVIAYAQGVATTVRINFEWEEWPV
nr:hypothetical protein [uncultured Roseateles sp.]